MVPLEEMEALTRAMLHDHMASSYESLERVCAPPPIYSVCSAEAGEGRMRRDDGGVCVWGGEGMEVEACLHREAGDCDMPSDGCGVLIRAAEMQHKAYTEVSTLTGKRGGVMLEGLEEFVSARTFSTQ